MSEAMRLLGASTSAIPSIPSNWVISVLLSPGQSVLARTSAIALITSGDHGMSPHLVFPGTGTGTWLLPPPLHQTTVSPPSSYTLRAGGGTSNSSTQDCSANPISIRIRMGVSS